METIAYIGTVPPPPKRKSVLGGGLIILITVAFVLYYAFPFFEEIFNESKTEVSSLQLEKITNRLESSQRPMQMIAATALRQSQKEIQFDPYFYNLSYPMGDIPKNKGMAADVVIRSLRDVGLDLQKEIHEDMSSDFHQYPQLWSATEANFNIDHRRIENIQRYLQRNHTPSKISRNLEDYNIGNIVFWRLPKGELHLGVVVPGPGLHEHEKWVVHHLHSVPLWENTLLDYPVVGNYAIDFNSFNNNSPKITTR